MTKNKLVEEAPYHPGYEDVGFEPTAWMYKRPNGSAKLVYVREPCDNTVVKEVPLYTHPVKELTDEEIKEIAIQHIEKRLDGDRFGYFDFARAILRKAQEK